MDSIKELIDAFAQRVRSPVIGYIILMALLVNWKAFFFVVFSGDTALNKFAYFDANTDWLTLLVQPIGLGIVAAIATPWINLMGQWLVKNPVMKFKKNNIEANHELALLRAKNKNAENNIVDELIRAREQDQRVENIESANERENLRREIATIRDQQNRFFSVEGSGNGIAVSGDARSDYNEALGEEINRLFLMAENLKKYGRHDEADEFVQRAAQLAKRQMKESM